MIQDGPDYISGAVDQVVFNMKQGIAKSLLTTICAASKDRRLALSAFFDAVGISLISLLRRTGPFAWRTGSPGSICPEGTLLPRKPVECDLHIRDSPASVTPIPSNASATLRMRPVVSINAVTFSDYARFFFDDVFRQNLALYAKHSVHRRHIVIWLL
jgi:hypothetical protein